MSLSVAERKILAEEWCQKAKGRQVITQPLGLNLDVDVEFNADEKKRVVQHFLCVLVSAVWIR